MKLHLVESLDEGPVGLDLVDHGRPGGRVHDRLVVHEQKRPGQKVGRQYVVAIDAKLATVVVALLATGSPQKKNKKE